MVNIYIIIPVLVFVFLFVAVLLYFTNITTTAYFVVLGILFFVMILIMLFFLMGSSSTVQPLVNHVYYPEEYQQPPFQEEPMLPPVQTFHIHNQMPEYPLPPDEYAPAPAPVRSTAPINRSGVLAQQQRYRQNVMRPTSAPSRQYPNGLEENYNVITPGKAYFDPARTVASTQQLPGTQQTGMFIDPRTGQRVRGTLTTQGGQVTNVVNGAPYQVRPAPAYSRG
jgi:uncharacterized iron-regulated membrane protein